MVRTPQTTLLSRYHIEATRARAWSRLVDPATNFLPAPSTSLAAVTPSILLGLPSRERRRQCGLVFFARQLFAVYTLPRQEEVAGSPKSLDPLACKKTAAAAAAVGSWSVLCQWGVERNGLLPAAR